MQVDWKRLKHGTLRQSGTPWELLQGTFRYDVKSLLQLDAVYMQWPLQLMPYLSFTIQQPSTAQQL